MRVDGSNRVTCRNRKFLRKMMKFRVSIPAPRIMTSEWTNPATGPSYNHGTAAEQNKVWYPASRGCDLDRTTQSHPEPVWEEEHRTTPRYQESVWGEELRMVEGPSKEQKEATPQPAHLGQGKTRTPGPHSVQPVVGGEQ